MRYKRQLMGEEEVKLDLTGSEAIESNQGGILVMGSSSNGAQFLKINEDGELVTTISDILYVTASIQELSVSNFPATQTVTGTIDILNPLSVTGDFYPAEQAVSVSNFPSVTEITGTVALEGGEITVGNLAATQSVAPSDGPSSIVSIFTGSTVSTQFLAANPDRKLATFFVSGTESDSPVVWLKLGGSAASTSAYSVILQSFEAYELPRGYSGEVHGVFNMTTGSVEISTTEIF